MDNTNPSLTPPAVCRNRWAGLLQN